MLTSKLLVIIYCLCQLTLAQLTDSSMCQYAYGNWTDCINYSQSRTVNCLCDGVSSDLTKCNRTLPVTLQACECRWKWSKWSKCTAECGGGNTTRVPQCFCNDVFTDDAKCDVAFYFGRETVTCNEYYCGAVPALNKLYWIQSNVEDWPIDNAAFNCSKGFDPEDSPKDFTYYDILADPHPSSHLHPEWHLLAKEWITSSLNLANGVNFPLDAQKLILLVGDILEQCAGWPEEELPQIYTFKEKLGRLNNNIGGLDNVDSQLSFVLGGGNQNHGESESRITMILAIAIPLIALVIVAVAITLLVWYVSRKTEVVKEKFESEDEDEPLKSVDTMANNTTGEAVVGLDHQNPVSPDGDLSDSAEH